MGRLTEIMAAVNSECPLDDEHFHHIAVDNEVTRKEIMDFRKELRKPKTLFDE